MPDVLYPGGGNCDDGTSPCVGPNCIGDPINGGDGPVIPPEPCFFGCSNKSNSCVGDDCVGGECFGPDCEYTTEDGEWHVYWMCDPNNGFATQVIVGLPGLAGFGVILLQSQMEHHELSVYAGVMIEVGGQFTHDDQPGGVFFTYLGMTTGSTLVEAVGVGGGIVTKNPWEEVAFEELECESSEPEPSETGCQDPTACNFSATATIHDQTLCLYISGCTEEGAFNYNAFAGCDDGTCCHTEGCTDQSAFNFTVGACFDDGSCCYVRGCMDSTMFNYDPLACFPGGCQSIETGCTDAAATNHDPTANTDDGSCIYPEGTGGCTVPGAFNYDPTATVAADNKCQWKIPRFCLNDVGQPTGVNPLFPGTSTTNDAYLFFGGNITSPNIITAANLTTIKDFIFSAADPYVAALEAILGVTITPGYSINYAWGASETACMRFLGYDTYYGDGLQTMSSVISPTPILIGPMASTPTNYFQTPNVTSIYTSGESCGDCDVDPSGCTDVAALNFDPLALTDDGSCKYTGVYGCTDSTATNYNPLANNDDGTCAYNQGCTDSLATNYNPAAVIDDGSCLYPTYGCTDPLATNYVLLATVDDGSCLYVVVKGCTDSTAINYNALATQDDGTCTYDIYGCTDSTASNYDSTATIDDGSCVDPRFEGLNMETPAPCVIGGQDYTVIWHNGNPAHNVIVTFEVYDQNLAFVSSSIVVASQLNDPATQSTTYFIPTASSYFGMGELFFKFKVKSLNDGTSDSSGFFQYCQ